MVSLLPVRLSPYKDNKYPIITKDIETQLVLMIHIIHVSHCDIVLTRPFSIVTARSIDSTDGGCNAFCKNGAIFPSLRTCKNKFPTPLFHNLQSLLDADSENNTYAM